jgi:hypothetical protein
MHTVSCQQGADEEDARMSTMRYSGEIRIRITYIDAPQGNVSRHYRCSLRAGKQTTTIRVGAPAYLTHTVDAPAAFDDAARTAIAFADADRADGDDGFWDQRAAHNDDGYHVARNANAFRGLATKSA